MNNYKVFLLLLLFSFNILLSQSLDSLILSNSKITKIALTIGDSSNVEQAIKINEKILSLDQDNYDSHLALSKLYLRRERVDVNLTDLKKAETHLLSAITLNKNLKLVDEYILYKNFAKNISLSYYIFLVDKIYKALIAEQNVSLLQDTQTLLEKIIIGYYKKAIDVTPSDSLSILVDTYNKIAFAYLINGNYELAKSNFEKSKQLLPQNFSDFDKLGDSYKGVGEFQNAIECYKKYLKRTNRKPPQASNYIPLTEQDIKEILDNSIKPVETESVVNNKSDTLNQVNELQINNNIVYVDSSEINFKIGQCYQELNEWNYADTFYLRAWNSNNKYYVFKNKHINELLGDLYLYASVHSQSKDIRAFYLKESNKYYENALNKGYFNNDAIQLEIANNYLLLKEPYKVLNALNGCNPNNLSNYGKYTFYLIKGNVLYDLKSYKDAISPLSATINSFQDNSYEENQLELIKTYSKLGFCHQKLLNYTTAIHYYNKVLEIDSSNSIKSNIELCKTMLTIQTIIKNNPNWKPILNNYGEYFFTDEVYLYHPQSVKHNNNTIKVWIKTLKLNTETKKENSDFNSNKILWQFDCKKDTYRILYAIEYDTEGKVINTYDDIGNWKHIIPDTISELLANFVCQNL